MHTRVIQCVVLILWCSIGSATVLDSISISNHDEQTSAHFSWTGFAKYKVFILKHPDRVVADFQHTTMNFNVDKIALNNHLITRIRHGSTPSHTLRVVFDMKKPVAIQVIPLSNGLRIDFLIKPMKPGSTQSSIKTASVFDPLYRAEHSSEMSAFKSKKQSTLLKPLKNNLLIYPVFTATVGASMSRIGQSQTYSPIDLCFYRYTPNRSYSRRMLWGGFIGVEKPIASSLLWALDAGVSYNQSSAFSGAGTLTQGADVPSSDSYKYSYHVQSKQLLVEGKFLWKIKGNIHPYLLLGVGTAFNKAYAYHTTVPYFFEYTPQFSNHLQTNFSSTIGAGIDVHVFQGWRVGTGYRFSNLGRAPFGSGQIDNIPISETLKQSHLYTNQLFLQLTYVPFHSERY